ncbi:replication-relaxation family protein [Streptomyces sp. NRRL S-920]|uniref:replication-relaxation family protein n=1 Tax=Streptomyces sp. NRRL S-920 TaxID=1463921 RepID=UPI000998A847|nr:replication-relaxation family protein [Streptomyces sp. NRRL S-920]
MAGKRITNPAGSTNNYRGDVLRVLGALKVATTDQIQRIGAPHLTFRHADKETPSKRKQARTASHTAALSDMRKHGLSENGGSTETGDSLRNLTPKGLQAASYELNRPVTEMGSTARGAGSSGASHPMAVNETVIAMLRPKPNMARLAKDSAEVRAAAQAAVDSPDGIGTIASFWTEVPLPATGTWNAPGKGGAQADIVLTAPQDGVPLLFIEVDNCHETAEELADKLEKYARFFRRKVKDTDGKERPMWRTRWTVPEGRYRDAPHPPVLLVFNRVGERNPNRTVPRLQELTRHLWQGERLPGGHHLYDRKIPIIATGLNQLRQHGPAGPVFVRFGRDHPQPLLEAIGNPRLEVANAREAEEAKARAAAYQEQVRRAAQEHDAKKAAEREARRPVCTGCGMKFTDARWEAVQPKDWGATKDSHPHLCDSCKAGAVASAVPTPGRQEEQQEPLPDWAQQTDFLRFPRRPRCTECKAAFTDERWKAVERIGWGTVPMQARPTLCGDCDQRQEIDWEEAWPGDPVRPDQDQGQEQDQAVPEQKAGGTWLSRFRR